MTISALELCIAPLTKRTLLCSQAFWILSQSSNAWLCRTCVINLQSIISHCKRFLWRCCVGSFEFWIYHFHNQIERGSTRGGILPQCNHKSLHTPKIVVERRRTIYKLLGTQFHTDLMQHAQMPKLPSKMNFRSMYTHTSFEQPNSDAVNPMSRPLIVPKKVLVQIASWVS